MTEFSLKLSRARKDMKAFLISFLVFCKERLIFTLILSRLRKFALKRPISIWDFTRKQKWRMKKKKKKEKKERNRNKLNSKKSKLPKFLSLLLKNRRRKILNKKQKIQKILKIK